MAKVGRNHPCPCGSSKKYKLCCLPKEEAKAAEAAAAARPPPTTASIVRELLRNVDWDEDPLDQASNSVVDLIHAGKLDEAESAARKLLVDYPEVVDGHDRLGMVYEARGDTKQAALHYRTAAAFVEQHLEDCEQASLDYFREQADKLDPPSAP
jgi:tetratricopeptide (TPR) repeat protein